MKRIAILHPRRELEFERIPQERPAESSTSSQGSDLLAEIFKILATSEYDDLANQVANIYAPSQERSAESSMSSQDSDLLAEISKIKDGDGLHSVSAESSMSSQGSDLLAEISKIISTSQDDGLAKQATNTLSFFPRIFLPVSSFTLIESNI
jgi:hypothetical protein